MFGFLADNCIVWFLQPKAATDAPPSAIDRFRKTVIVETIWVMKKIYAGLCAGVMLLCASFAYAAQPTPWQTGFQPAATSTMEEIVWFEAYTLIFIIPITILVLALLAWVMIRYRASVNPSPSRTSHNTTIEVIWTVGPVIILLFLAVPSFQILTSQLTPPENPELTIKTTGYQWYWGYEYQADETLSFDSLMVQEEDREELGKQDKAVYPRLLAVDNEVVVPVDTTVRLLVTAADVIHAFAMPAFGLKIDAIPGRLNETWFKADREGLYYGQCSELCGKDHAYMPIAIRVVSRDQYDRWMTAAIEDLEGANRMLMAEIDGPNKVASAQD